MSLEVHKGSSKQPGREYSFVFYIFSVLFAVQPLFCCKISGWYINFSIHHSVGALQCSEDPRRQPGVTISHCSDGRSEHYEKQEGSCDANGGLLTSYYKCCSHCIEQHGPCMSHSIILLTRSSCKCGVLFKGCPSVIKNGQVSCLCSLSIRLRGRLGKGSREGGMWKVHFERKRQPQVQYNLGENKLVREEFQGWM